MSTIQFLTFVEFVSTIFTLRFGSERQWEVLEQGKYDECKFYRDDLPIIL